MSPRRLISKAAVASEENFLTDTTSTRFLPLEGSGTMINTLNDLLRGVDLTTLRRLLSVKFNPPSRHPATSSKAPVTLTPAFRDASALHSMTLLMLSSFPRAAEGASATAAEEEDDFFRPTPIGISAWV